jgi:hypothetical protein
MKSFRRASNRLSSGFVLLLLAGSVGAGVAAQSNSSMNPTLQVALQKELQPCLPEPCVIDLINGESATQAFYDLLLTIGVPGGIAELPNHEEQTAYAFDLKGRSVADFLNAFTTAEPRYRWTETDGALNLIPVKEPLLLSTLISDFSAQDANVLELIETLKKNPDFQISCKKLNCVERSLGKGENVSYGYFGGAFGGRPRRPAKRLSFRLRHLTVRQILNEIVKREGIWRYREFGRPDGSLGFDLYISDYLSERYGEHDQN